MEYDDILEITDSTFDYEVLDTKNSSLVYFLTRWSSDCRERLEMLLEYFNEFKDKIRVFTVDVDKSQRIVGRYGIRSVPTIIMFRLGEEAERFSGDFDPVEIQDYLAEFCAKKPTKSQKIGMLKVIGKKRKKSMKTQVQVKKRQKTKKINKTKKPIIRKKLRNRKHNK